MDSIHTLHRWEGMRRLCTSIGEILLDNTRRNIGALALAYELRFAQEYCLREISTQECCPEPWLRDCRLCTIVQETIGSLLLRDLLVRDIVQSETGETGRIFYVRCACHALKLHE
jgi:hypothetical protein